MELVMFTKTFAAMDSLSMMMGRPRPFNID